MRRDMANPRPTLSFFLAQLCQTKRLAPSDARGLMFRAALPGAWPERSTRPFASEMDERLPRQP